MKTAIAVSHQDLIRETIVPDNIVDLDDEFCEWFGGKDYIWISAVESKSYNFKKLPTAIKTTILKLVESKELPNGFIIYFDR